MYLPAFMCGLWLFLSCSLARDIEYTNVTSFAEGNYTARWRFHNETDSFYFKVEAKATGWVGFGISRLLWPSNVDLQWNRHSMRYYDVIVGGVYGNGTEYYKDYMTDGHMAPKADQQQDWRVTKITENEGVTSIEFYRKKNTSDPDDDNVIGPGLRWIVWAFHDSLDISDNVTNWKKHTQRGFQEVDFLKQPGEKPEVAYYRSDPPTTGASTIVASIVGNFLLFIIAGIFFY